VDLLDIESVILFCD